MKSLRFERLLVVLALACGGCESLTPSVCDSSAAAGLVVTVTQLEHGPPLCDADVTLSNGTSAEKLTAQGNPCTYTGAYEQPGTYTVTAAKAGMAPQTRTGIVVEKGECHVVTRALTIALKYP